MIQKNINLKSKKKKVKGGNNNSPSIHKLNRNLLAKIALHSANSKYSANKLLAAFKTNISKNNKDYIRKISDSGNYINKITKLKKNLKNEEDMVKKYPLDINLFHIARETRREIKKLENNLKNEEDMVNKDPLAQKTRREVQQIGRRIEYGKKLREVEKLTKQLKTYERMANLERTEPFPQYQGYANDTRLKLIIKKKNL